MSTIGAVTYEGIVAVTQSDATDDTNGPFAGFIVTVAGTIQFTNIRGGTVTLTVLAGLIYPIATKRVWSTGTTATGVYGLQSPPYKKIMDPGNGIVLP